MIRRRRSASSMNAPPMTRKFNSTLPGRCFSSTRCRRSACRCARDSANQANPSHVAKGGVFVRRPKSDIPTGATERVVRKSKQTGPLVELGRRDCIFKGECVGYRTYDAKGRLQTETSL